MFSQVLNNRETQIDLFQICENLKIPEAKSLLEATKSPNISNLLKERTNQVLALGAFGLPWITLEQFNSDNNEVRKLFLNLS